MFRFTLFICLFFLLYSCNKEVNTNENSQTNETTTAAPTINGSWLRISSAVYANNVMGNSIPDTENLTQTNIYNNGTFYQQFVWSGGTDLYERNIDWSTDSTYTTGEGYTPAGGSFILYNFTITELGTNNLTIKHNSHLGIQFEMFEKI